MGRIQVLDLAFNSKLFRIETSVLQLQFRLVSFDRFNLVREALLIALIMILPALECFIDFRAKVEDLSPEIQLPLILLPHDVDQCPMVQGGLVLRTISIHL